MTNQIIEFRSEKFYDEPKFRTSKRWKRYVSTCQNTVSELITEETMFSIGNHFCWNIAISFPEMTKSYPHFRHYLFESPKDPNKLNYCMALSFFYYWITPTEMLTDQQDQELFFHRYTRFGFSAKDHSDAIRASYLEITEQNLPDFLSLIQDSFEQACFFRLQTLVNYFPGKINQENYYRLTVLRPGVFQNAEICQLITHTIEIVQTNLQDLRVTYLTSETQNRELQSLKAEKNRLSREYEKQISSLNKEIEKLKSQNAELSNRIDSAKEIGSHKIASVKKDYKAQLATAKEKEITLKQELKKVQSTASQKDNPAVSLPENENSDFSVPNIEIKIDHNRKYAFIIDGDGAVLPRLKKEYPNSQFLTGTDRVQDLNAEQTELVVAVTKFIHHASAAKYKTVCDRNQIPFLYWSNTNIQNLDQRIAAVLPSAILSERSVNQ